jgi:hypothetical protein
MLAKTIEKRRARIDPQIVLLAVNRKRYRNRVLRIGYFRRFVTPDSIGHPNLLGEKPASKQSRR